jgi:hypothetical protein
MLSLRDSHFVDLSEAPPSLPACILAQLIVATLR